MAIEISDILPSKLVSHSHSGTKLCQKNVCTWEIRGSLLIQELATKIDDGRVEIALMHVNGFLNDSNFVECVHSKPCSLLVGPDLVPTLNNSVPEQHTAAVQSPHRLLG